MIIIFFIVTGLILFFLVILTLVLLAKVISIFSTDAPFIPIPHYLVDDIVKKLQLKKESVLYDLGCGDARILKKAVNMEPRIRAVGIEIALIPFMLAKFFTRKYEQIIIKRENVFETDISDATHIFLYLYPKAVNILIDSIKKQCKIGTLIISCDFEIKSCKPKSILEIKNNKSKMCQKLFIYTL